MDFNKAMIDLVKEIRRRVPADDKPGIKLANPELLNELIPIFHSSKDTILTTLIKELFERAGEDWPERLVKQQQEGKRQVTQVYRGQVRVVTVESESEEPQKSAKSSGSQRIYRGQVVREG
jgi:hypothetical protein